MPDPDVDAIPEALTDRDRWLLWSADADDPRRPHWRGDFGISWSDSGDWHSFQEAVDAASEREEWGIGYVFLPDDPLYVIDVDGAVDEDGELREWVPDLAPILDAGPYAEWSPSGTGIHIPIPGAPPEWWSDCEVEPDLHQGVDVLTNKFCTVTGDALEGAGSEPTHVPDVEEWLLEAYRNIRGELPRMHDADDVQDEGDDEWAEDAIADALDALDPDMAHDEWIRIGYAVHDWDASSNGKRLFEKWSASGRKFDEDAKRQTDWIWRNANQGRGVTLGTLIHQAQEAGWSPPSTSSTRSGRSPGRSTSDPPDDVRELGGLTPDGVRMWHGLGDDESISDLNDRQRAAAVWELAKRSDDVFVRARRDNDELWAYDDGIWKPEGVRALRHAARKALGATNYGVNVLNELKAQVRGDPTAEVDGDDLGLEAGLLAVENGLVDLEAAAAGEDALRDLRPEDYALTRLPVEFDPDAEAEKWDELVEEWAEEGRAAALQEYVGYCLHVGELPIHRALLLVGSGSNGKGTFLGVVRALLGRDNTTSIELQTLANEHDAVADFHGSLANIDDDLSSRSLGKGLGMFKKLVAGDRVRGRRLYHPAFEYQAAGKHLYAANEVPDVDVPDEDEAFWRRWILVEFPNHYPKGELDPTLEDELVQDEQLSGILNWAIDGWARLLEQGHFTDEERWAQGVRRRWQEWGESVDKFIAECVSNDPEADRLTTQQAHQRFAAWCRQEGEDPVGQRELTNRLRDEDVGYRTGVRIDGKSQRGYKALGLSDDVPPLEDTPDRNGTGEQVGLDDVE